MSLELPNSLTLHWEDAPLDKKEASHSWCEIGKFKDKELFQLFYSTPLKMTYVYDIMYDVTYEIPSGAKAKGYMVAYKLFKYYIDTKIII